MPTDYKLQFKSAFDYGVDPALTSTDMTAFIQTALNDATGCPNGSTLYFPPGTYKCTAPLVCNRAINIWAYGVTFDFGTTDFTPDPGTILTAFTYGSRENPRVSRTFVGGLTVTRTATAPNAAAREGRGFRWYALVEGTIDTCRAVGFERGHWITGSYDPTAVFQGGGGADGTANFNGGAVTGALLSAVTNTYILTRTVNYVAVTIAAGYTVDLSGYVLNYSGTLTNNGTIEAAVIKGGTGGDGTANFNGGAVTGASLADTTYTLTRTVNYVQVTIAAGYTVVLNGNVLNYTGALTNNGKITYSEFGNVYNNYRNLIAAGCRYGLYLEPGDSVKNSSPPPNSFSGWSNENNFWGGRMLLVSGLEDPANFQAIHIQWQLVGTPPVAEAHGPNNNRFYGISLEGNWGRKIFCEGVDNIWIQCRYEIPNLGTDIEFANTASGVSGSGNVLLYGNGLSLAVVASTGSGAVRNQKVSTVDADLNTATLSSAVIKTRNPAGGSSSILRVLSQAGTEDRIVARESIPGAPAPADAGWTFHGSLGAQQNALYLKGATQLATLNGLVVNDAGADADTRVAGDAEPNLMYLDASADRLGVGTATPALRAHITGPHVSGLGTLAVVNTAEHAYFTLDHGTTGVAPGKNGGMILKQLGVSKFLVDHVEIQDYLRIYSYGAGGEVLISPAGSGWVGLPHGTNPSKPADLPAAELDLYDGRISQMGWDLKETVLTCRQTRRS